MQRATAYMVVLILARAVSTFDTVCLARAESHAASEDCASGAADRSAWALRDSEAAIAQASRLLGLVGSHANLAMSAELTILEEDNTPHLSDQLVGTPLWQVTIRNWSMELPSIPPGFRALVKDRYVRTVDVYLDPESGQVLKVKTRWPEGEPSMAPEPNAASATRQLANAGQEVYHEFPVGDPKVTLLEALDSMQRGGALPGAAKQVVAHYVIRSACGKYITPRAVWAITLRGEPPLLSMVTAERYQNRYIVDAETGEYLCASNIPKPEPNAEPDTDVARAANTSAWKIREGQPAVVAGAQDSRPASQDGLPREPPHSDLRPKTAIAKNTAIAGTARVLGMLPEGVEVRAEALVDTASLNLPFIRHQIAGQKAWHVVVENWRALPGSEYQEGKQSPRTWDVFLSAEDGRVLRVASRWPANVPPIAPEPSAESAEKQMGNERYHEVPDGQPLISLSNALDATGYEEPIPAQQIVAQYVVWSGDGKWKQPRPVWAITFRGIPPFETAYPGIVPEHYRNHIRYIVDPVSKKWLCASSTPQPEPQSSSRPAETKRHVPAP